VISIVGWVKLPGREADPSSAVVKSREATRPLAHMSSWVSV
jgi:hypothetical protein